MTAVLPPPINFQGFTQNGTLNAFGFVATYAAGSTTPIATYTDATQTTSNPNPVPLNAIGQAAIWLAPGVGYKFVETDQFGNQCGFADQINASGAGITTSLIPANNNILNVGSPALQWANGYFGTAVYVNGVPLTGYPLTIAETAAGVTPLSFQYAEGDIRRYGATLASTDNHAAFNAALAVSAAGGNAAFIPGGNWAVTSTPTANSSTVTGPSSMYGVGQLSVIVATGCDGLSFLAGQSNYEASRFFRDFSITGSSASSSTNNGITVNLPSGKIIGVQFSNLTIQNFSRAVYVSGATGLWNSAFIDCFLYNNYQGYSFNGQTVYVTIRGGLAQTGSITGSGLRYGFLSTNSGGGNGQSLVLQGFGVYGYDYGMSFTNTVQVAVEHCSVSIYNVCGIYIQGTQGGMVVRDTWVQSALSITNYAAIYVADLGSPLYDKIILDGNILYGNTGTGSCGVYLGVQTGATTVTNNIIGNAASAAPFVIGVGGNTPGALGVSAVGTGGAINNGAIISGNTIDASTTAITLYSGATNIEVGPNTTQNGTALVFSAGTTPPGLIYATSNTKGTASFGGATSISVIFAQAMPNAGYFVSLGGNLAGNTWASNKSANGFTINCSIANSNPTDWSVSY